MTHNSNASCPSLLVGEGAGGWGVVAPTIELNEENKYVELAL